MMTSTLTPSRILKSALPALLLIAVLSACSEKDEPAVQLPPSISSYQPNSTMIGQKIIINGANFGTSIEDVEVTFYDGEVAVVDAVTSNTISVTVPENAFVGPVKVKVKELEVEGGEFTAMTMCTIWLGDRLTPIPCPRVKPNGAL